MTRLYEAHDPGRRIVHEAASRTSGSAFAALVATGKIVTGYFLKLLFQ
jgi:hypothetical protein